jgi:hypothetical protein
MKRADNGDELLNWRPPPPKPPPPPNPYYLRSTGRTRENQDEYELNPHWDGTIRGKGRAREEDPLTSIEAAENVDPDDAWIAKICVDRVIARNGGTIIAKELFLEALKGVQEGWIKNRKSRAGQLPYSRAESIRRRFSDLTGNSGRGELKNESR